MPTKKGVDTPLPTVVLPDEGTPNLTVSFKKNKDGLLLAYTEEGVFVISKTKVG